MKRELLLWVLAVLILRGLFVVGLSDIFFFGEELEKGAAAKALIDGIDVAYHRLAYHYYEGGGFAVTHLKAAYFLLVGESLLAQRLAGMTTCLLVFLALWRLVDHHFGRRAARLAALLFLFGPASFQRYSLLSLGIHFEAMAFGLFILDGGLRLAFERDEQPTYGGMVLLGLVSGFGLFFSYQNALFIGAAGLLFLAYRTRVLFSLRGLASIGGFVVGLAPLLYMYAQVGQAVFDIHGTDLTEVGGGPGRIAQLLGACYEDAPMSDLVPRALYPLSGVVGLVLALLCLRDRRRHAALGLIGFVLLWLTAWALGPFVDTQVFGWFMWMRLAPLTMALMILGAAGVDAALSRGGGVRRVAAVVFGAVLMVGLWSGARIAVEGRPTTPLRNLRFLSEIKGYDYRGYFPMLLGHLDGRGPRQVAPLLQFDEPDRDLLRSSLAVALFENRRKGITLKDQIQQLERLEPEGTGGFVLGIGASVLVHRRGDVAAALEQLSALPMEDATPLAEAVAYFPGHRFETQELLLEDISRHGRGPLAPAYLRGLGARAFRSLVMSPYGQELAVDEVGVRALLEGQEPDLAPHLLLGFEQERARWTLR